MTSLDALVAGLPSISLAELMERAELLQRTDRKYIVSAEQLQELLRGLGDEVRVLEMQGHRVFRYESVYFDTPDRASYRYAAHRRRHRFKVRTRTYVDTSQSFLEVKVRDARRQTVKLRIPCATEWRHALDADDQAFLREIFIEHHLDVSLITQLAPALQTGFRRATLYVPGANCRVTVDTDLTFSEPGAAPIGVPEIMVLETKSGTHDQRVDRLLWHMGVRPQRVSKFAIGSALLDPQLPDNKWARTISRHFAAGGARTS